MSKLPSALGPALCCAILLVACGGDDKPAAESTATPAATEAAPSAAKAGCKKVTEPKPAAAPKLAKPKLKLDRRMTYVARVVTSCGEFEITLDAKRAPVTGGSFVTLVRKRFFDGLIFHRISPGFVIQGGDPEGSGNGGPGYTVVEPPPDDLGYVRGIVAMAKTATDPAGSSGSQFFVMTEDAPDLAPDYALLGKVTKGQDVVDRIGVVEVGPDEKPTEPVVIESIELDES